MVNTEDFTKRLHEVMEYYDLSAASFADRIEVGRSSISHLLSGRNKPSLDFVMKIIHAFPEVELYWLLNGKGNFPHESDKESSTVVKRKIINPPSQQDLFKEEASEKEHIEVSEKGESENVTFAKNKKEIQKIVIFYKDGSFDAFDN